MNRNGSAYVLVVVVAMSIMIMLAIAVNISSYEAKVSQSYKNHANLSLLATNGILRGVLYMNAELDKKRGDISNNTITGLSGLRLIDHVDFTPQGYILKDFLYAKTFAKEAEKILLPEFGGKTISYTADGVYTVTVKITKAADGYLITSTAGKYGIQTTETATADVALNWTNHEESVQGNLIWKSAPGWVINGVTKNFSEVVSADAFEPEVAWSEDNRVFVTHQPTELDVSQFSENTVFISLSDTELFVNTSDSEQNFFRGVIFAQGNVNISEVNISGAVISRGSVILSDAAVTPENLVLPLNVVDKTLSKSVLKFFNILSDVDFEAARAYIINPESDICYRPLNIKSKR